VASGTTRGTTRAAEPQRLIALGAVMGAHGVRGELRVKPYNEASDLLPGLGRVFVRGKDGQSREHEIESVRLGSKGLIFAFADVTTPEAAKALYGAELCVPRAALPELGPGEFYFVDLPGLWAVLPDGSVVGQVERVQEYPASSVLCVTTERGLIEVPLREPYLVAVDVAAERVTVDHLDDLI
jgi:16S rRNA processing protein RimM